MDRPLDDIKKIMRTFRPIIFLSKKDGKTVALNNTNQFVANNKQISFATPNNISLCLSISEKQYTIAKNIFLKLIDSKLKSDKRKLYFREEELMVLYDYFEHLQVSLIFAYTAIESFANISIPEDFQYEKINHKKVKEIWNKQNIERWISTSEKIDKILPKIFETKSPKEEFFWKNFISLETIRNNIIHQKNVTNGKDVTVDYEFFFDVKIFDSIRAGYEIINFFCRKSKHTPNYFPLGIGKPLTDPIEIDDFDKYFNPIYGEE